MKRRFTIALVVLVVLVIAVPTAAIKTGRRVKRAATLRPVAART